MPVEEDIGEEFLFWEGSERPELAGGEGLRSIGVVEERCDDWENKPGGERKLKA